jgi:hypothetical protein
MGIEAKKKSVEENLYELSKKYTVSDIRRIVDAELNVAGLLLMPVFAGSIALGNVLYGFDITDKMAFSRFACERMGIEPKLAEILYDVVYKGLIRQWTSKTGVFLDAVERGVLWARRDEKSICIYALELAIRYTDAVARLPEYRETAKHLGYKDITEIEPLREQIGDFISANREVE